MFINIILNIIKQIYMKLNIKLFYEQNPNFDLKIYKKYNKELINLSDIDLIKHYNTYGKKNNLICSDLLVNPDSQLEYEYGLTDNVNPYINININLYKFIYNNDYLNNVDNNIYSYETFNKYIDDFDYNLFKNNIKISKRFNNNSDIINFYINNIQKINYIYSIKLFYIKYSSFNLDEYKLFNNKIGTLANNETNLLIFLNKYHLSNKDDIIISVKDFYNKNKNFNLINYKKELNDKNIIFNNDNNYILHWINYEKKIKDLYKLYPTFDINIYKYFNKYDVNNINNILIYSIETFLNNYDFNFNFEIYKLFNNFNGTQSETILHYLNNNNTSNINIIYNKDTFLKIYENEFSLKLYKELNKDLQELSDDNLILHWKTHENLDTRIYSIKTFQDIYNKYDINDEDEIIYWMNNIRNTDIANNIYEVLIDLENNKKLLKPGISLIIRAKNEELNIKDCIESIVDLVDEIIFVDNNSNDSTYELMLSYTKKYSNIKLYKYNINVSKAGVDHQSAIKTNDKNTLGTFYNWCLSKATKYNVFKWDADFICIRNNFIELVNTYNLKKREDKLAIWFTGKTVFENNNNYYINYKSVYNEYRIFSYKNDFKWYDGLICEYTEPYLLSCKKNEKYIYEYPLFYEIKRTSIDEFKERSSLIDHRDINDFDILNKLKTNNDNYSLININNLMLNQQKIIIYTPSLNFGGGNQFIISMYTVFKSLGFNVKIIPISPCIDSITRYNKINNNDIINISSDAKSNPNISADFIIFNSDIPIKHEEFIKINSKIIFITHSDVAYANYFIKKYHKYFYKIITVNDYTKTKLLNLISNNIDQNKFTKLINYSDIDISNISNITKKYKFGIISRFSEDKNIPMFLMALIDIFKKYSNYKCYLIGTHTIEYDNYLKYLCKIFDISNNVIFEGYQDNVKKYYEILDFIILPSVSEGCSYNIIEAMSYGLPVITSNVGGNHELIKNEENGLIYDYDGIREYEKMNAYITNYNKHLEIIGYFINNEEFKKKYKTNIRYITDVIMPSQVICLLCNNKCFDCTDCTDCTNKTNIFKSNMNNIYKSVMKIINYDNDHIRHISDNNKKFINENYNENIYVNQIISLI